MEGLVFAILTVFSYVLGVIFSIKKVGHVNILVFLILFMISALMLTDNTIDYYNVITYTNSTTIGSTTSYKIVKISNLQPLFPLIPLTIFILSLGVIFREIA